MLQLKAFSSIGNKMLVLLSGLSKKEKKEYCISTAYASVKYSHTLIQQVLLYIALANSKGIIPLVPEDELAAEMDCSLRTIQHNNKILSDAGILDWERRCTGCIRVTFHGYLQNVLDLTPELSGTETKGDDLLSGDEIELSGKFKSEKGYTIMSAERIRELVNLKDVNALRVALRFYRAFEKEVVVGKQKHAYVTYEEFKQFLPKYLHFPKAINELAQKVKALFDLNTYKKGNDVLGFVKDTAPAEALSERIKGNFLARLTVSEARDSRQEKATQVFELKGAYNRLRKFVSDKSDFHSSLKRLSDGEAKALVSSFGIEKMRNAITVLVSLYKEEPISLDESDKPPLMQRFEFNPSLCLREIANNF